MTSCLVKRVIFIRPGETDWNRQGRWQGWTASPLSAHGRRQAEKLAKFVRHIGMTALYTSDLKRALETAQIVAETVGLPLIADSRLRERGAGVWQGLTVPEMRAWYPAEYQQLIDDPEHFRMDGGESRAEVRARMNAAFAEAVATAIGETIAILSHTTAIRVLLSDLVVGYDPYLAVMSNSSVTTLYRTGVSAPWKLIIENDVSHLEGMESRSLDEIEERTPSQAREGQL